MTIVEDIEIVEITAEDPDGVRTWAAICETSHGHEVGEHATPWAAEEVLAVLRHPAVKRRERFWVARLGGGPVGAGLLSQSLVDNLDSAEVGVHVLPDERRRGTGSLILAHVEQVAAQEGRMLLNAEVSWPYAGPADGAGTPGAEFARRHGYAFGLGDIQRSVRLPFDNGLLAEIAAEAAPHHADYRILSWSGRIPDDLVEGWLAVANTLLTEAPTGDMEREEEAVDVATFRDDERLQSEQGRTNWHTVALDPTGDVVAYSQLVLPSHDPHFVYQWGTLVRRDHRGHRLGLAVKVANHQSLQAGADVNGRRVITWNAEENDAMIAINERLGFEPVARMAEMQKRL